MLKSHAGTSYSMFPLVTSRYPEASCVEGEREKESDVRIEKESEKEDVLTWVMNWSCLGCCRESP